MRKPLMALLWAVLVMVLLQATNGSNEFDDDLTFDDVPSRPEGPGRPSDNGIASYFSHGFSRVLSRVKRQWDFNWFSSSENESTTTTKKEISTTTESEAPPITTTTTTAIPTLPEVSQTHSREERSTLSESTNGITSSGKSTSGELRMTDDEDFNTASGSGAEWESPTRGDTGHAFRSETYVIFRIKMYVHEFWVAELANTHSPAFDKFAKAFTKELEQFFDAPVRDDPALPGSRRATVIGIKPSTDDRMLVLVTADLGSKGFDESDTIKHRLRRHLTDTSSMGIYTVKIDKDHPLSVQKFTEPNTNGFSECEAEELVCNDGTTCLPLDTRCNGYNDCPDGSDEDGCPQPGEGISPQPAPFTPVDGLSRGLSLPSSSSRCDDTKRCPDGVTLICADLWCDGVQDCPGTSEEDGCPGGPTRPIGSTTESSIVDHCLTNEFMCDVNRCIPLTWRCNGVPDCEDRTDEESDCPARGCSPGDFLCRNRKCIRYYQKCDMISDCDDGEDEENCSPKLTKLCPLGEFTCGNGICIELERRCDEVIDCPEASDEIGCPCLSSEFQCDDGKCIEKGKKCDQKIDCLDGSDERDCDRNLIQVCKDSEFDCGDICISRRMRCDDIVHCDSGADEIGCDRLCSPPEFKCSNGTCIPAYLKCNGKPDCPNGEDEKEPECPSTPTACLQNEFACNNGQCVRRQYLCDSIPDCSDQSDEDESYCREFSCLSDDFYCGSGKCIRSGQRCDDVQHCDDGSDEENCPSSCAYTEYECESGQCIQASERCNNVRDCEDGSDEKGCYSSANCNPSKQFTCDNGQCVSKSAKCNNIEDCSDGSDEINCITSEIQLITSPTSQEIEETKEAVFQCRDEGPSRYRVRWIRGDGQPLPEGSRTLNNGARLEIPNVQLSATGAYVCEAVGAPRTASGARATVYLKVNPFIHIPERIPETACDYNEATCYNRQCIPKQKVCDGEIDCSDGSDESRCSAHQVCEANQFMCDNRECVMKTWRCDNQVDCLDGSDEKGCEVSKNGTCYSTEFACTSGNQCIPRGMLCDKTRDCHDNSDEIGCKDPEITLRPEAIVRICEGNELVLRCQATGFPIPIINWRLNWAHVPKKCRMINEDGLGTLVCPDMRVEDTGAYSCEAINGKIKFANPDANVVVRDCDSVDKPICQPGSGLFNDRAQSIDECIKCFCFGKTTDCSSAKLEIKKIPILRGTYPLVPVKFEPSIEINSGERSPVQNYLIPSNNGFEIRSSIGGNGSAYYYFSMPHETHGKQLNSYGGFITYKVTPGGDTRRPYIDIPDVVIQGNNRTLSHKIRNGLVRDRENEVRVQIIDGDWLITNPSEGRYNEYATREDIMMTLADIENILIRVQYIEGPGINTAISDIDMDTASNIVTGRERSQYIEQCRCPRGYTGLSCEVCEPGFVLIRQPGSFLGICSDQAGPCSPGTYGAPERGIPCRPCPCPLSSVPGALGTCRLGPSSQAICDCQIGYVGYRCERCDSEHGYRGDARIGDCRREQPGICNEAGSRSTEALSDGTCACKTYTTGDRCDQCKQGSFFLSARNPYGCTKCFCMGTTQECSSSNMYRDSIETRFRGSSLQDFVLVKKTDDDLFEKIPPFVDQSSFELYFDNFDTEVYYWALPPVYLFNKVVSYGGNLRYTIRYTPSPGGLSSKNSAPDVEIRSANRINLYHYSKQTIEPEQEVTVTVPLLEEYWQKEFGQKADREDVLQALADISGFYIKATYTTSTTRAALISVSLDIATDRNTGRPKALEVEQCRCLPGYMGTSCEDCSPGYTRTEDGLYLRICEQCDCGGYSEDCDPDTGECYNCRDNRAGTKCEYCKAGFTLATDGTCRPNKTCSCDENGTINCRDGRCNCKVNVEGENCGRCRRGTFYLSADNEMGCEKCYCSEVTSDCQSSSLYMEQVPAPILDNNHGFTLSDGSATVIRDGFNPNFAMSELGYRLGWRQERLFWSLPSRLTGDKVLSYGGTLAYVQRYTTNSPDSEPTSDHDIIISGNGRSIFYTFDEPLRPEVRREALIPIVQGKWRVLDQRSGNPIASRRDILKILSNVDHILIRATLAKEIEDSYISDVLMETATQNSYGPRAEQVEVCRCPPEYRGTSCQTCSDNHYRNYDGRCLQCPCVHGRSCLLSNDYQVKCNCDPGWQGDFCDVPETVIHNVTLSMEPAGRLEFAKGQRQQFRCEYSSSIPVHAQIREVHSWTSFNTQFKAIEPPARQYWRLGEVVREIVIGQHLIEVTCVLMDDREEIVGQTQAYIKVRLPDDNQRPPDDRPQIRMDISVSPQDVISEGSRVTLTCTAENISREPLTIRWSKEGGRLPRVIDDNRGRLTIISAQSADSGIYYCTATSKNVSETKSIIITVDIMDLVPEDNQTEQVRAPSIQISPSSTVEALEGSEINVQCIATGYPLPSIQWIRIDGRPFGRDVEFVGGDMRIKSGRKSDQGEYECRASNPGGYDSTVVTIYVREIVGNLIVNPREIMANTGQTITITCSIEPPTDSVQLEWSRNDKRDFPRRAESYNGQLTIRNIGPTDAGEYVCTATMSTTGYKVSEARAYIRVIPVVNPRPFRVIVHPSRLTVSEHETAVINCTSSLPDATFTWTRARGGLPRKAQVLENILRIPNVEKSDRAVYVCEARLDGRVSKDHTFLEVQKREVVPVLELTETSLLVIEGGSAHVECRPQGGSPPARVIWTKRGGQLPRNVKAEGNLLRFNAVILADADDYVCTAENSAGKTSVTVRLEVHQRPKIRTEPKGSVRKAAGEKLLLTCRATGVPAPAVKWQINTQSTAISSRTATTTSETGVAQVEIFRLSLEDTGYYTCRASSPAGEAEESVYVRVFENLRPDGRAHGTFEVDLGGDTEITCSHPTNERDITYTWSRKDGEPLGRGVVANGYSLRISDAQLSDAGDYVCEISDRNGYPQNSHVATLRVIERLNIRLTPESQIVHPGEDAYIRCEVIGDRPADLSWEGVDRPLPSSAIVIGGRITFNRIAIEDAGRYACTAVDPETQYVVKALARVTVKRPPLRYSYYDRTHQSLTDRSSSSCLPGKFQCHNGAQCLEKRQVCDRTFDCNDRSDELNCFFPNPASYLQQHFDPSDHKPIVRVVGDRNITKMEGTSLFLQCTTDIPNAKIEWTRQGDVLPLNSDLRDNDLRINNLYPEDSGDYICTAKSRTGIPGSDRVTVTVEQGCSSWGKIACNDGLTCYDSSQICDGVNDCPDGGDELMCSRRKRNHGALLAKVSIEPSVDRIRVGETVDLRCMAVGVFASELPTWEKVGGGIADNVNIRDNILRIHDVSTDNAGPYRCWVKKQNGEVVEDIYRLEVQDFGSPPKHTSVTRLAEKTKTAQIYDPVDIECDTGLEPPVTFLWTRRNGQLILNQTGSKIHLDNVMPSDAGEYLCVASNGEVKIEFPTFLVVKGLIPRFTQQSVSYLKLKPMAGAGYRKFDLLLSIKPERPNGLILYNGEKKGEKKDFIAIGLRNGHVEFRFDVGSGAAIIQSTNITVPMNKWSNITVKRHRKEGRLWVNGVGPFIGTSPGRYQGLDLNEPMFLGSVPDFNDVSPVTKFDTGFVGCISYLKINDQVEELAKALEKSDISDCDTCQNSRCSNNGVCQEAPNERGYTCLCPRGFSGIDCQTTGGTSACYPGLCNDGKCVNAGGSYKCQCSLGTAGDNCELHIKVNTPAFNGDAYLAYPLPHTSADFSIEMEIKPDDTRNGLLAYSSQNMNGNGDFVLLLIRDQQVEFTVDTGSGLETVNNPHRLLFGKWVKISANKTADELRLTVNGDTTDKPLDARKSHAYKKSLNLHTPLYLGGYDDTTISLHPSIYIKEGFKGCISSLRVNGRPPTNLLKDATGSSNVGQCHGTTHGSLNLNSVFDDNLCGEQLCENGGRCDHSDGTPVCLCTSDYGGQYCEVRTNECGQSPNPCGSNGVCRKEKTSPEGYICDCIFGFTGPTCQEKAPITTDVTFRRDSFIELPGHLTQQLRADDEISISFTIQTEEPIGLLYWQGSNLQYMSIGVIDGMIEAEVDHNDNPLKVRSRGRVDNALPHNVTVTRKASDLQILMDDITVATSNGQPPRRMSTEESIFIGGLPDPWSITNGRWKENFVGCILRLRINNGEPINFSKFHISGRNVRSCPRSNRKRRNRFLKNNETG